MAGRLRPLPVAFAALAALGLIVYDLQRLAPDGEPEPVPAASTSQPQLVVPGRAGRDPEPASGSNVPRAGSLEETLLTTSEANRNHILQMTIRDLGFECPEVISSGDVGREGSAWRVNCSETQIYSVDIDEFGALSVTPVPYGDFAPGPPVPIQEQRRQLNEFQQN